MQEIKTAAAEEQVSELTPVTESESLPSLASIFNPEEFFDLDQIEDAALSRMCCFSD